MKLLFLLILMTHCFISPVSSSGRTRQFAGSYSLGNNIEKGRVGSVDIYPETDSTILFYLQANRGAPSYGMGEVYGRAKMNGANGIFYKSMEGDSTVCKLLFFFSNNKLKIQTADGQDHCGFGFGVYADGVYKKISKKIPATFTDETGHTYYFSRTDPANWQD